jgi:hypothetical protein
MEKCDRVLSELTRNEALQAASKKIVMWHFADKHLFLACYCQDGKEKRHQNSICDFMNTVLVNDEHCTETGHYIESCACLIFISIFLILNLQIDTLVRPDNVPELRFIEEAICLLNNKCQRTDIEFLSSQAVVAPSHKLYYMQVYEVFLDQLPPCWTKVLIVLTILSSYQRWIHAGFPTWHVTPDEHSHIIVVYLDWARSHIYFLNPNNSFKLIGQKNCTTRGPNWIECITWTTLGQGP